MAVVTEKLTDADLVERFAHFPVDHDSKDFYRGWLEHELRRSDYRRPIAAAIARGDAEAAAHATREALTPSAEALALLAPHQPERRAVK